jgi:4-hydroxybenzoate polyprenyltransferase
VRQQGKEAAARIFTDRRLRYIGFIAPFFYIASYLLFYTLDRSWPWLVLAVAFFTASIAAGHLLRRREHRRIMAAETADDDRDSRDDRE